MEKKMALLDMQTDGEPIVLGFKKNYAGDQLITEIPIEIAKNILSWRNLIMNDKNLAIDKDVEEYLDNI